MVTEGIPQVCCLSRAQPGLTATAAVGACILPDEHNTQHSYKRKLHARYYGAGFVFWRC
jgi:hypothetical protein